MFVVRLKDDWEMNIEIAYGFGALAASGRRFHWGISARPAKASDTPKPKKIGS